MTAETTSRRPDVVRYTDYRAFVRDMIAYLREVRPQFSYRWFARVAGFKSPSFLKLVADGERNLSTRSIERFANGFDLIGRERDIFETLVLLEQATTDEARNRYVARLQELSAHDPVARLQSDQFEAYSRWYAFVIREMASRLDFDPTPESVASRLRPRVRPVVAKRAMALLQRLGLLVPDEQGIPRPAEPILTSGPAVRSLAVRNFHRKMLELAARALDSVPRSHRNITSVTVPLSRSDYDRVCSMLAEVRAEVLQLSERSRDTQDPDTEVHQLCFSLFPVTGGDP